MRQALYATMLIAITVGMATALVALAIVFDTYVFDHKVPLPSMDISDTLSDLINGRTWNSIVTQFNEITRK